MSRYDCCLVLSIDMDYWSNPSSVGHDDTGVNT